MSDTADRLSLGEARIVTMRELSQDTARVMAKINEEGRPALVTRHGRFQAVIWPVASRQVESLLLSHINQLIFGTAEFDSSRSEAEDVVSTDEARRELY